MLPFSEIDVEAKQAAAFTQSHVRMENSRWFHWPAVTLMAAALSFGIMGSTASAAGAHESNSQGKTKGENANAKARQFDATVTRPQKDLEQTIEAQQKVDSIVARKKDKKKEKKKANADAKSSQVEPKKGARNRSGDRNSGAQRVVWIKVDRNADPDFLVVFFATRDLVDTDGDGNGDKRHFWMVFSNTSASIDQVNALTASMCDPLGTKSVKFDLLDDLKSNTIEDHDTIHPSTDNTITIVHQRVTTVAVGPPLTPEGGGTLRKITK